MDFSSKKLVVTGKVQGVWFRVSTQKTAQKFSIWGNVKNLKTGQVEIFATGKESDLLQFENWCKMGPENAKVTRIDTFDIDFEDFGQEFLVIR